VTLANSIRERAPAVTGKAFRRPVEGNLPPVAVLAVGLVLELEPRPMSGADPPPTSAVKIAHRLLRSAHGAAQRKSPNASRSKGTKAIAVMQNINAELGSGSIL